MARGRFAIGVREIDGEGRIVLPKDVRERTGLLPHTSVEVLVEDGAAVLRPYRPGCAVPGCRRVDDLVEVLGVKLCREHAQEYASRLQAPELAPQP